MLEFVALCNENDYEKYKLDLQDTNIHMIKEKELDIANVLGYMINTSTLDELDRNIITSFFCIVFLPSENGQKNTLF